MGMTEKSLQEQVLERLAEDVQKSLDFGISCAMLEANGWTVLEINYIPDSGQAWNTVINWADETFEGKWKEHNGTWLIENSKDATMFALKWKVKAND